MSSKDIDDYVDNDDDVDFNNSNDDDIDDDDVIVVDDDDDDYNKLQSDRHLHDHNHHHSHYHNHIIIITTIIIIIIPSIQSTYLCIHRRLGIQQGSSKCILDHGFFSKIDTKAVLSLKANPPFKPSPSATHEPLANLPAVRPYHGDQKIFADF